MASFISATPYPNSFAVVGRSLRHAHGALGLCRPLVRWRPRRWPWRGYVSRSPMWFIVGSAQAGVVPARPAPFEMAALEAPGVGLGRVGQLDVARRGGVGLSRSQAPGPFDSRALSCSLPCRVRRGRRVAGFFAIIRLHPRSLGRRELIAENSATAATDLCHESRPRVPWGVLLSTRSCGPLWASILSRRGSTFFCPLFPTYLQESRVLSIQAAGD